MINENRPFEQAGSRRAKRQKIQLKNFAKQFKDRKPIKKFTDFTGESIEQASNKEKILKHINNLKKKLNDIHGKISENDLNLLNDGIKKLGSDGLLLPEEELIDIHQKFQTIYDRYNENL